MTKEPAPGTPKKTVFGVGCFHMRHGFEIRDYFTSPEQAARLAE